MSISQFSHLRPRFEISQEKTLEFLAKLHADQDKSISPEQIQDKFDKIRQGANKIATRGAHLNLEYSPLSVRTNHFYEAAWRAFEHFYGEKAIFPKNLIHVTCTGYTSPSPAQKIVSERRQPTYVTHAYHMGCYGSIPALRIARGFKEESHIVHTEVCSLHINPLCHTAEQLVIESLFADGFIKYTVSENPVGPSLKILNLHEEIIPDSLEHMKWSVEEIGLKMTLSKAVPIVIARAITPFVEKLAPHLKDKALFAIHPGGPKILDSVQELLQLTDEQVFHSKEVLKHFGNMSSATLPHIWEKMLQESFGKEYIISLAFGPGLTICGALFKIEGVS